MFDMDPKNLLEQASFVPTEEQKELTRFVSQILLFSGTGKVLTVLKKRERSGIAWDLPGGGVDPNESFRQTALREFPEELSLSPGIMIPFALSYEKAENVSKKDYMAFTFVSFMNEEISPIVDGQEHVGHSWVRFENIHNTLTPRTKRFDRHLLSHPEIQSMTTNDFMGLIRKAMQPSHPSQRPSWEEPA